MPHVTVYNAHRISRSLNRHARPEVLAAHPVYERPVHFLAEKEQRGLRLLRALCAGDADLLGGPFDPIVPATGAGLARTPTPPCYHDDPDCACLAQPYTNHRIPEAIAERGAEAVAAFRAWYAEKRHLLEGPQPERFTIHLHARFGVWVRPEEIHRHNSGRDQHENPILEEVRADVDRLLAQSAVEAFDAPGERYVVRQFATRTHMAAWMEPVYTHSPQRSGMDDAAFKDFLRHYEARFKRPVKNLLRTYYRVLLNPDLSFEGRLLERLGFRACRVCCTPRPVRARLSAFSAN